MTAYNGLSGNNEVSNTSGSSNPEEVARGRLHLVINSKAGVDRAVEAFEQHVISMEERQAAIQADREALHHLKHGMVPVQHEVITDSAAEVVQPAPNPLFPTAEPPVDPSNVTNMMEYRARREAAENSRSAQEIIREAYDAFGQIS